ncbi:MAG: cation transporter [Phycisphaerales bacterium]|nr:MAG: cation transporter [Phycisphaerales bacterium]
MDDRFQQAQYVSKISLALNGGLALVKLVTGMVGQSYALIADAVESMGDIFSSAIVWGGVAIASRPADADHPYGHGKAEPLAALAVAGMLIAAAVGIALQAVHEINSPGPSPAPYTLMVLLVVIAIKEWMYRYESRIAREVGSTAVDVDAWHHRSDAFTSAAAAIGITVALIGGEGYSAADDWAALFACGIIAFNGSRFARSAIDELMDTAPHTSLVDGIRETAEGVEGARFVEKVVERKVGPNVYIDLHLQVDPEMSVRDAHKVAHAAKGAVMSRWTEVADVLVHVEPHDAAPSTG